MIVNASIAVNESPRMKTLLNSNGIKAPINPIEQNAVSKPNYSNNSLFNVSLRQSGSIEANEPISLLSFNKAYPSNFDYIKGISIPQNSNCSLPKPNNAIDSNAQIISNELVRNDIGPEQNNKMRQNTIEKLNTGKRPSFIARANAVVRPGTPMELSDSSELNASSILNQSSVINVSSLQNVSLGLYSNCILKGSSMNSMEGSST